MNCVGIDVSKGKSMIAVMRPFGEVVISPFEVQHTASELSELAKLLKSLDGETRVVMESTGNYHTPVAWLLHDAGLYVSVVNAYHQLFDEGMLVSLDDFGDAQLFEDKTIYSSIILLSKEKQYTFVYSSVDSANKLWAGEEVGSIKLSSSILNKLPWRLTPEQQHFRKCVYALQSD